MEKFFVKIADNRDSVHNYCNDPLSCFDRRFCEWYLHNNNDEIDYNGNFNIGEVHFAFV